MFGVDLLVDGGEEAGGVVGAVGEESDSLAILVCIVLERGDWRRSYLADWCF